MKLSENTPARAHWWLIDTIWLLLLSVYLFSGLKLIPFHGDEAAYVWLSQDFRDVFLKPNLEYLYWNPDFPNSYEEHLQVYRVETGPMMRYGMGFAWWVAGFQPEDIPADDWRWEWTYQQNVDAGYYPPEGMLLADRMYSTALLALGAAAFLLIVRRLGGRLMAYPASLIFVTQPLILLEGRRAMSEGPMTGFWLLALLAAAVYLLRRDRFKQHRQEIGWLALIGGLGALSFTSKQTGLGSGVATGLVIGIAALIEHGDQGWLRALWASAWRVGLTALAAMLVSLILLIPYWRDPLQALNASFTWRSWHRDTQAATWKGYETTSEHIDALYREMLLPVPMYADISAWFPEIADSIWAYRASPFAGLPLTPAIRSAGGALAVLGLAVLIERIIRGRDRPRRLMAGLLLSSVFVGIGLTYAIIDLEWQRYYFPTVVAATMLQGVGLGWLFTMAAALVRRTGGGALRTRLVWIGLIACVIGAGVMGTKLLIVDRVERPLRYQIFQSSEVRPSATPLAITYGDQVRLLGIDAPTSLPSGGMHHVRLMWQLAEQPITEEYATILELVDTQGTVIAQSDSGYDIPFQTSSWVPGAWIEERLSLRVPPGTAPGEYTLRVRLFAPRSNLTPEAADDGGAALGTSASVASIRVTRPPRPVDPGALGFPTQAPSPLGDSLAVIASSTVPSENQVGQPFYLTLGWQAEGTPSQAYQFQLLWLDGETIAAVSPPLPLTPGYRTNQWRAGDVWKTVDVLTVPGRLEAGRYTVAVQLVDADRNGVGEYARLPEVMTVGTPPRSYEMPTRIQGEAVDWQNGIRLLGYEPRDSQPGVVKLTLYWQPGTEINASLKLFVHLIDDAGELIAQQDSVPMEGGRPTTGWAPGEVIAEPVRLEAPPGTYHLRIGWYDPSSGTRVPLADGGDFAILSTPFVITAP